MTAAQRRLSDKSRSIVRTPWITGELEIKRTNNAQVYALVQGPLTLWTHITPYFFHLPLFLVVSVARIVEIFCITRSLLGRGMNKRYGWLDILFLVVSYYQIFCQSPQ